MVLANVQNDNPHNEDETPYGRAKQELVMAAWAFDSSRVRELFETTPLNSDDATEYLELASPGLPVMRSLLERGADAGSFNFRLASHGPVDVTNLPSEVHFDVKFKGHSIRQ